MFSRPWFTLLRRQVLIHRRVLAFVLTVAAVLLAWAAFVARPPVLVAVSGTEPAVTALPALRPGFVRLPVRFADGEMAALLRPSQQIQLWATDARTQRSGMVAADAQVLEVPGLPSNSAVTGRQSRLVVVGVRGTEVAKVASVNAMGVLTYVVGQ